jgi:hypothetical protein
VCVCVCVCVCSCACVCVSACVYTYVCVDMNGEEGSERSGVAYNSVMLMYDIILAICHAISLTCDDVTVLSGVLRIPMCRILVCASIKELCDAILVLCDALKECT